jgi:hypothetical protein
LRQNVIQTGKSGYEKRAKILIKTEQKYEKNSDSGPNSEAKAARQSEFYLFWHEIHVICANPLAD